MSTKQRLFQCKKCLGWFYGKDGDIHAPHMKDGFLVNCIGEKIEKQGSD